MARFGIDRGDVAFKPKLNAGLGVLTVRTQRQPVLRRGADQIILRQVRGGDRLSALVRIPDSSQTSRHVRKVPTAEVLTLEAPPSVTG
jgi:hypothetical protein